MDFPRLALWGFADVLMAGFAGRGYPDGPLHLHRTGAFLPPITFPYNSVLGHLTVVSDDFRGELERSLFRELRFVPAVKARIIGLAWDEWDLSSDQPEVFPENDPEDYIWDMPHEPMVAARMPDVWELVPPLFPLRTEWIEKTNRTPEKIRGYPTLTDRFPSIFLSHRSGHLIVDRNVRDWFQCRVAEWVEFIEVEMEAKAA